MSRLISSSAARDLRPAAGARPGAATRLGVLLGLAALALYAATGSRGVEWQDAGVHQYRILVGQLESPVGLALSHPLHYWLGRATLRLPLGDPLHRLNLLSGVFGAIGVGVLSGLVVRLTSSRLAGGLAGVTLALAQSYWQLSARTDTYTVAAALMTVEWALLLRYAQTRQPAWLVAVFAINGLHVADHLLGLLPLATYGILLVERIVRRRIAVEWLPVAIVVWLATSAPYSALVVSHWQHTGDLGGTARSALFGGQPHAKDWARSVLNVWPSATQAKLAIASLGYCFPSAAVLVALVGLFRRLRPRARLFRHVLLAQTIIVLVFVGRYNVPDVYKYFVPVSVVTALWFGIGVAWLLRRYERPAAGRPVKEGTGTAPERVLAGATPVTLGASPRFHRAARRWVVALLVANALLPIAVYYYFPIIAESRGWLRAQFRDIPYRNEYLHFFRPWRFADHTAAVFSREALARIGENGWLLADSTTAYTVAATYLVHGGPAGARVYWWVNCLTDPGRPKLTDDELRAFVEHGGRVLGVPASVRSEVENTVHPPLVIDRTEPFWHIRLGP
jgi:hypothetical protein